MDALKLSEVKKIHFVGIKGVAMTSLAIVALEYGISVSGSDSQEQFPTEAMLKKFAIPFYHGFTARFLQKSRFPDLVIYTGAHGGMTNKEVVEAHKSGIPTMSHGQALGLFMESKKAIAIAGSHGKTTTSAMIATVLMKGGYDPCFAVGCGEIFALPASGHWGKGEYFVAEADEYATDPTSDPTPRFLWQRPTILVVTNIEYDHPDVYNNVEEVENAFVRFAQQISSDGYLVAGIDSPSVRKMLQRVSTDTITFGVSTKALFHPRKIQFKQGYTEFEIFQGTHALGHCRLSVPGMHNVLNSIASYAALSHVGIPHEVIIEGLGQFTGTKRRFERIAEKKGIVFYDDYAHHPTEIRATLSAARLWYPTRRIIAIFQPHTYSRTHALLNEFATSFTESNYVLFADIYASSREKETQEVSSRLLAQRTSGYHTHVFYTPQKTDVIQSLAGIIKPNDIVITMGAGDIYQWLPEIIDAL